MEHIRGEVLVIAGGDDRVWPSTRFAREIGRARDARGLATTVITHQDAGHRLQLPGEHPVAGGVTMQRGGSSLADAELGERAWPQIVRICRAA